MAREPRRTRVAWPKVYLALTALSIGLLGLARYDVPPFDGLPPVAVAALIVALFAVASLSHWYDIHRWRRRNEDAPPDFLATLDEEIEYREDEESEGNDAERKGHEGRENDEGRKDSDDRKREDGDGESEGKTER
ncbi:DUF202 domain-containing protein [Halorussus salinisoli]|uniref:DUF202 domain-containing protein n=1 Tax=Halorussus salinisoli TaxID=2558242 RepID=UPI0010C21247|nr:DUF202 domain-containing protein [Halorussus salinisoli]